MGEVLGAGGEGGAGSALCPQNCRHTASICVRSWVIHLPPADMLSPNILEDESIIHLLTYFDSQLIHLVLLNVLNFIYFANLLLSRFKYVSLPEESPGNMN